MDTLKNALHSIPAGADLLLVGALLAVGTQQKTVPWIAFGLGGAMLFLSMQKTAV
jgi:hypothetical protein